MTEIPKQIQQTVRAMSEFKGKTALVTGATGQLGRAITAALRAAEAEVICTDLSREEGSELVAMDVTSQESVDAVFEQVRKDHGPLDILINNAGVSCFETFDERSEENLDWVYDVNLKGAFFCLRAFASAYPREDTWGSIVNIASLYGIVSPDPRIYTDCDRHNPEIYGATKAGLIQMTKYFAVHLAERNIRVNAISPGGIFNPDAPQGSDFRDNYSHRCPMGRMADAEDMVGGVLFLASESARYVNGHNLVIDGGFSCW